MAKSDKVLFLDPSISEEELAKSEKNGGWYTDNPLAKSLIENIKSSQKAQAIAFDINPQDTSKYSSLYIDKTNTPLLPDLVIKKIAITDDLIAAIVRCRSNNVSAHGAPLQDRYSTGYRIDPVKHSGFSDLPGDKKAELIKKAHKIQKELQTCGNLDGLFEKQKHSFSEFLYLTAANAVRFGRVCVEIVYDRNKKFCGFRAIDPSTIVFARKNPLGANNLRQEAFRLLESISKETPIDAKRYKDGDYSYIQVIDGVPKNAFTDKELVVFNFYPTTDIECNYYPITPIDTVINQIITHINITTHNKLYFQNGRASKGLLVINSDSIADNTIMDLRQQFNATMNGVQNAWRVPVLKVGKEDKLAWQTTDSSGRDMEFQYLFDTNIRIILSAFQMSPDEIPGFAHLSKGTNSQSLSESNNEYKLEAARDVGIRPLLSGIENFLNTKILPFFDEEVHKYFKLKFYGLDSESPEKEAARIEKEQQLWSSFNDTRRIVEKDEVPAHLGGDFPMSAQFALVLDKYVTVGEIKEHFFGIKGASKDPRWDYVRDNFYFNHINTIQQQQQAQQQQQMAQQQMAMQAQQAQQPQDGDGQGEPAKEEKAKPEEEKKPEDHQAQQELETGVEKALQALSKSQKKSKKK